MGRHSQKRKIEPYRFPWVTIGKTVAAGLFLATACFLAFFGVYVAVTEHMKDYAQQQLPPITITVTVPTPLPTDLPTVIPPSRR